MKRTKKSDLKVDIEGTEAMRSRMAKVKKIKITINLDVDSLDKLKSLADKNGSSYQKLLNQLLRESLVNKDATESRLDKLEKEFARLKKKYAA